MAISEDSKKTIDSLSEDELVYEVERGRSSRFQREKFDYVKFRYKKLMDEKVEAAKSSEIKRENSMVSISKKSYRMTVIGVVVAIIAIVVTVIVSW